MPTENVIWGSLFFVITSIAVLLGPGFGFWVVPAVVVIVVLGTGTPGGNSCEVKIITAEVLKQGLVFCRVLLSYIMLGGESVRAGSHGHELGRKI